MTVKMDMCDEKNEDTQLNENTKPQLRYACANQAVQRLRRGPHDVSYFSFDIYTGK
jgi:hypothetical protein